MQPAHSNYLVTGGAGFIGGHLVGRLLDAGHRVWVIDDLSTGRLANIEPYLGHERFRFAQDSITNLTVLDRLGSESDIIVHLAAAVGVQLIVDRPVHTIETNVMGTELVLQVARRYRAKVLLASSSEVYGKGVNPAFAESDDLLLGPTSKNRWAYAASKMVDEFLGLAYNHESGLPVVVMRFFNTVGPGQSGQYGMVMPRFVEQAARGEPLTVYGDGTQSRCFCDVRDVVEAIVALASHPEAPGQVFNIGGREEISISDLARRIIARVGSASEIAYIPYEKAYGKGFEDLQRRVPDTSKIHRLLGWQPKLTLDQTIEAIRDSLPASPDKQG